MAKCVKSGTYQLKICELLTEFLAKLEQILMWDSKKIKLWSVLNFTNNILLCFSKKKQDKMRSYWNHFFKLLMWRGLDNLPYASFLTKLIWIFVFLPQLIWFLSFTLSFLVKILNFEKRFINSGTQPTG